MEEIQQKPPKVQLINTSNPDQRVIAQFNPTTLEESLEVLYQRQAVLGLSHEPMQYQRTANYKIPIELYWTSTREDARAPQGQQPNGPGRSFTDINQENRRNLLSWCYPERGASDILGGAPPRLLFIWPEYIAMTCVITSVRIRVSKFSLSGKPDQWRCTLNLEEISDVRLTQEEVRDNGTIRGSAIDGNPEITGGL